MYILVARVAFSLGSLCYLRLELYPIQKKKFSPLHPSIKRKKGRNNNVPPTLLRIRRRRKAQSGEILL